MEVCSQVCGSEPLPTTVYSKPFPQHYSVKGTYWQWVLNTGSLGINSNFQVCLQKTVFSWEKVLLLALWEAATPGLVQLLALIAQERLGTVSPGLDGGSHGYVTGLGRT